MRRLKHEPDAIGHSQVFRPVPSGAIELEDDPLLGASAHRFGEVRKNGLEQLLETAFETFHTVAPAGRLDEAPDVEPFVAVMAKRNGPFALGRPDPSAG